MVWDGRTAVHKNLAGSAGPVDFRSWRTWTKHTRTTVLVSSKFGWKVLCSRIPKVKQESAQLCMDPRHILAGFDNQHFETLTNLSCPLWNLYSCFILLHSPRCVLTFISRRPLKLLFAFAWKSIDWRNALSQLDAVLTFAILRIRRLPVRSAWSNLWIALKFQKHGPTGRGLTPLETVESKRRLSTQAMEDFICCLQRDYGARQGLVMCDATCPIGSKVVNRKDLKDSRELKSLEARCYSWRLNILSVGDSMAEREAARRTISPYFATFRPFFGIFRPYLVSRKASAGLEKKACRAGEPMWSPQSDAESAEFQWNIRRFLKSRPWCKTIKFQVWIPCAEKTFTTRSWNLFLNAK